MKPKEGVSLAPLPPQFICGRDKKEILVLWRAIAPLLVLLIFVVVLSWRKSNGS